MLPDIICTMPIKGEPTKWLPKEQAICFERFKGYQNDRYFMMTDQDNCHIPAHKLYDIEPNIIIYNPAHPQRHQAFWMLRDPVYCQPQVRASKPYKYLKAIESAFDAKYGCDPHFARHIHRNPFYWAADVDWRHDHTHTLSELADVVELGKTRVRAGSRQIGAVGRNVTLFNELRHWAYKNALEARTEMIFDDWHKMVMTRALNLNRFEQPLELNEVISTAKSIAEFCYYRYQPNGKIIITDEFRALQARLGSIGGKKGSREDKARAGAKGGASGLLENKIKAGSLGGKLSSGGGRPSKKSMLENVLTLKSQGYSNRAISKELGIGAATVSRYINNINPK